MFFVALLGWGRATAAGTEQDLENGGGEAAGRPALRQPVLTDEQRDEIREAFDLYVPCRLCYFGSWRRARLCGSDELCDGLSMVAPFFCVACVASIYCGGVLMDTFTEVGCGENCIAIVHGAPFRLCATVHAKTILLFLRVSTTFFGRVWSQRLLL